MSSKRGTGQSSWCRHPLAHLVEAADDICYSIIDLEDAVELNILSFKQVSEFFLSSFSKSERADIERRFEPGNSHRINLARLRAFVFDKAIAAAIELYLNAYTEIMEGAPRSKYFRSYGSKRSPPSVSVWGERVCAISGLQRHEEN